MELTLTVFKSSSGTEQVLQFVTKTSVRKHRLELEKFFSGIAVMLEPEQYLILAQTKHKTLCGHMEVDSCNPPLFMWTDGWIQEAKI